MTNYPNAGYRLLIIEIDTLKRLSEGYAIHPSDRMYVVRVLWIQANVCAGILKTFFISDSSDGGVERRKDWERGLTGRTGSFAVARRGGEAGRGGQTEVR